MSISQIALKEFEFHRQEYETPNKNDLSFQVLQFQQIAWHFGQIEGYIIVAETHWNLLLNYYLYHQGGFFTILRSLNEDNSKLTLEVLIDPNKKTQEVALICSMFMVQAFPTQIEVLMSNKMQTTVSWKGLYIDLFTGELRDRHHHIDPYAHSMTHGGIVDSPLVVNGSIVLVDSDEELWKLNKGMDSLVLLSSKKRSFVSLDAAKPQYPIICHMSKISLLPTSVEFECASIYHKCLEHLTNLPKAKRYYLVLDSNMEIDRSKFDPEHMRLLGISGKVIEKVKNDTTGMLFHFMLLGCRHNSISEHLVQQEHMALPNVFSAL